MKHAIIIAAGRGVDGEPLNSFGGFTLGGVTQLKRLIVTAERAGIKEITVIVGSKPTYEGVLSSSKYENDNIAWHNIETPLELNSGPYLVLQSNLVTTTGTLSRLTKYETLENESVIAVGEPVVETLELGIVGAIITSGTQIEKLTLKSLDLSAWCNELKRTTKIKYLQMPNDSWMRLCSDKSSLSEAQDLLFSDIRKSERGWKSRNINRRISIPISRLLINTTITPNLISAIVGIVGVLTGVLYAFGYPVWGGILMELSSILDGCDGEVAKMKLRESRLGQWIDTIFDQTTYVSFLIGVPLGYYFIMGNTIALFIGCMNIMIYIFSLTWGVYFLGKYADSGSMVSYPSVIDELFPLAKRSYLYKLVYRTRPLIQREYFAFIILLASVFGGYPLVLGITSLSLILIAIHLFDDFLVTKRLEAHNRQLLNKA